MRQNLKPHFLTPLVLAMMALCANLAWARSVPKLTGPVVDEADLFNSQQKQILATTLASYYTRSGKQLQILTVASLEGDQLEDFSIRTAEAWKIGNKSGSGVILLVASQDRQMRLEVGQGLEGELTDAAASRIIRDIITPSFKNADYFGGVAQGVIAIAKSLGDDLSIEGVERWRPSRQSFDPRLLFGIIFLVIWFFRLLTGGSRLRRGSGAWLLSSSAFGRGGGSSGGGGGWSGGGGGFSGGGASGRW